MTPRAEPGEDDSITLSLRLLTRIDDRLNQLERDITQLQVVSGILTVAAFLAFVLVCFALVQQ